MFSNFDGSYIKLCHPESDFLFVETKTFWFLNYVWILKWITFSNECTSVLRICIVNDQHIVMLLTSGSGCHVSESAMRIKLIRYLIKMFSLFSIICRIPYVTWGVIIYSELSPSGITLPGFEPRCSIYVANHARPVYIQTTYEIVWHCLQLSTLFDYNSRIQKKSILYCSTPHCYHNNHQYCHDYYY